MESVAKVDPPAHYICPITLEVMKHPVQHQYSGFNFEQEALFTYLFVFGKTTCPLTRQPIQPSDFVQNTALRREINIWKQLHLPAAIKHTKSDEDDSIGDESYSESEEEYKRSDNDISYEDIEQMRQRAIELQQVKARVIRLREERISAYTCKESSSNKERKRNDSSYVSNQDYHYLFC